MEGLKNSLGRFVIDLGVAALTLPGQSICGDQYVVQTFLGGVLLAVVDGIGHGEEAAEAAEAACGILQAHAAEPLVRLVERCHDRLHSTRGAVMSLAAFDVKRDLLTWLGIGNVQGVLRRFGLTVGGTEESLLLRAGVVGAVLPQLRESVVSIARGNTLILATDGVQSGFAQGIASGNPQKMAEEILDGFGKGTDDALVLVARYWGNRTDGNREDGK